ncbi:hypothetical protein V2J09_018095 [Rumex salicifolius]
MGVTKSSQVCTLFQKMTSNILSLGQFLERGYDIHLKEFENLLIRDHNGVLIAKVKMKKNRMFPLNIQNDVARCLKSYYKDYSYIWNLRFGHLNFGSLELLSRNEMVRGMPSIKHTEQLCKGCLLGKQIRKSFPKETETRARRPLELIHTDVCDPLKPNSLDKRSLRYLTCTRPDILYSVGFISRFVESPNSTHHLAAKRILIYLKGTISFVLFYSRFDEFKLFGFSDNDWSGDIDDHKSTTRFVFFMGNTAFTWLSRKQPIVTLSTCEDESMF